MQGQPNQAPRTPKRVRVEGVPNLYIRPADGKYEAGYTGSDSRWHMKTLAAKNLTQAKTELRALLGKRDTWQDVAPTRKVFAEVWREYEQMLGSLVASGERSERTLEAAQQRYNTHLKHSLDLVPIQKVTARHLSDLLADLRKKRVKRGRKREETPLSSWTLKSTLALAGAILQHAVVRGYRADNPMQRLSKAEKPKAKNATDARVLLPEEVKALIQHALPTYRSAIATACFTGLRSQELLGLRWVDVELGTDGDPSYIRVGHQLTRAKRAQPARLVPLKSDAGRRDIEIPLQLAKLLREHKLASRFSSAEDFVFTTEVGTPIYYRNLASRGLDKAANSASLNPDEKQKLSLHDLRHTAITHLIRAGADVGQVARFAGHARPSVTLDKYLHEFEARKGNDVAARLGAAFGDVL